MLNHVFAQLGVLCYKVRYVCYRLRYLAPNAPQAKQSPPSLRLAPSFVVGSEVVALLAQPHTLLRLRFVMRFEQGAERFRSGFGL